MSLLKFDKRRLGTLDYTLSREMLLTGSAGGYLCTTLTFCNTRKYHGLFVSPVSSLTDNAAGDEREYVLLSSLDETIVATTQSSELATHLYPDACSPQGYRLLKNFEYAPHPVATYRTGEFELSKELVFCHTQPRLMIRYRLHGEGKKCLLRLRPFLAFRDKHSLSKANFDADSRSYPVTGGVRNRLYGNLPWLYLQTDAADAEFVAAPDWYYNFEYPEERARGYDYREDILTTGYFEIPLESGQTVIFSCGFEELEPTRLTTLFEEERSQSGFSGDFIPCLRHSARQFVRHRNSKTEIIAGFPWFGSWGRDTLIALPGLATAINDPHTCLDILDTLVAQLHEGLLPNTGTSYNSVDAPLWFFHTIQRLAGRIVPERELWRRYGSAMMAILNGYRNGTNGCVKITDEGLVSASHPQLAMTWMDAVVDGHPVTGREGLQVEINALWYNAVCYTLELASRYGPKSFVRTWSEPPQKIRRNFMQKFWYTSGGYLADYVSEAGEQNIDIRPNQVIACSLGYKIPNETQQRAILEVVKRHLLTPRGLRSLSPENPSYKGIYTGNQTERDCAYHQGTVWVWPLEHYVKARLDLEGEKYVREASRLLAGFKEDLNSVGIGSVSEIYDGDAPQRQRGAISQAWSIGALLSIDDMINRRKSKK